MKLAQDNQQRKFVKPMSSPGLRSSKITSVRTPPSSPARAAASAAAGCRSNAASAAQTASLKRGVGWPLRNASTSTSANQHAIVAHSPMQNHILAALPATEFERLLPHLEFVPMPLGEVLYESGARMQHVYFPTNSIVSLSYVLMDGASAEIAVVGNEGIVGISLFMGGETTPSRAVVQSAGYGYRLKAQTLKDEFNRAGPMLHLLLRYTQALITQMTQTAVCNRHHSVEQQVCRRLLLSLDRLNSDSLAMTQELIANMLGVRREGVTEAAGHLQRAGLISYSRGRIDVLDRPGLEKAVCECYGVVKLEFDRLLSDTPRKGPFHVCR